MITFFRRVLPLLRPAARRKFFLAAVLMMVLAGMEALALVAVAPLIQLLTATNMESSSRLVAEVSNLFGHPTPTKLALDLAILTISLYVVKSFLAIATFRWAMGFSLEEEAELCGRLMRLYLHAPYEEHLRINSSDHVRTLTAAIRMIYQQGFVAGFGAIGDSFSVLFVGAILIYAGPVLALVAIGYFALITITYQRVVNQVVTRRAARLHVEQAADFRTIYQALTAIKEIKIRGTEDQYANEVYARRHGLVPAYRSMALVTMTPRYVLELAMVGAAASIAAVAYSTESINVATANVGLFVVGGFRLLAPLNKIIFGNAQAKSALPSLNQVTEDLASMQSDREAPVDRPLATKVRPRVQVVGEQLPQSRTIPRVELHGVSFSYTPGAPVLSDLNFAIEPGESIGLVGGSGAGKSTLVDVLLGLLTPDHGQVLIDGQAMANVKREWNLLIGYVPQSIALFDDTVEANVAFGAKLVDDEVRRCLELAQLAEVVDALPEGAKTVVGEAGTRLSGGQRQRLGVARALYRRPKVLMFDEATSALDNETEFKLTEVLETLRNDVTTVTIAHRLSTVRRCDRVLYLEAGRLVASGPFSTLSASIPGFARLVELSTLDAA